MGPIIILHGIGNSSFFLALTEGTFFLIRAKKSSENYHFWIEVGSRIIQRAEILVSNMFHLVNYARKKVFQVNTTIAKNLLPVLSAQFESKMFNLYLNLYSFHHLFSQKFNISEPHGNVLVQAQLRLSIGNQLQFKYFHGANNFAKIAIIIFQYLSVSHCVQTIFAHVFGSDGMESAYLSRPQVQIYTK